MRPLPDSMLLLRLWPTLGTAGASSVVSEPFTDPSAALLSPCVAGKSNAMGLAAVSPIRGALTASIRSVPGMRDRFGDGGAGCAVDVF